MISRDYPIRHLALTIRRNANYYLCEYFQNIHVIIFAQFFCVQGLKYFFFQSKGSGDNQCPHPTNKLDKAVRPTQECLNRQNWWKNYTCKLYCPDGKRPAVSGMRLILDTPTLPQPTLNPRKDNLVIRTVQNITLKLSENNFGKISIVVGEN